MDAKHSGEVLKYDVLLSSDSDQTHLEKQSDLLMEAYGSLSHELHKLQVEEEMLMRKFYDVMKSKNLMEKVDSQGMSNDKGNGDSQLPMGADSQK